MRTTLKKLRYVAKVRAIADAVASATAADIVARTRDLAMRQAVLDEVIERLSAAWMGKPHKKVAALRGNPTVFNGNVKAKDRRIAKANARYVKAAKPEFARLDGGKVFENAYPVRRPAVVRRADAFVARRARKRRNEMAWLTMIGNLIERSNNGSDKHNAK